MGMTEVVVGQFVCAAEYHPAGTRFTWSDDEGNIYGVAVGRYMGCLQ